MRRLRIAYVCHSFPPHGRPLTNLGGMQRVGVELLEAMSADSRVEVIPIVLRASWRSTHARVPGFLSRVVWRVRELARQDGADVVLFSSMVTATTVAWVGRALRRHGVKSAAIVHGRDVTLSVGPYQWLVGRVLPSLDGVLPVSRATALACRERGAPEGSIQVVPNGVDPRRWSIELALGEARRRLREIAGLDDVADETRFLIVSVGRPVPRKGFDWFLRCVLPSLPGRACYVVVGKGRQTSTIQRLAHSQRMDDRVRVIGAVSDRDLRLLYHAADVLVMPNVCVHGELEGFGVVSLEAGASGLPTVAADLEGPRDVVYEGENGFRLPSGDARAWSLLLSKLVNEPERLNVMRRTVRRFTLQRYAWSVVAPRYVEALEGIAGLGAPSSGGGG